MRRIFKYLILFMVAVFLLFGSLVIFTQTRIFKNWLRAKIVAEGNKALNGALEIGRINGNLINHFEIFDILIANSQDTVFYIPKIIINFVPKKLFDKEISIRVVALDSPYVRLHQLSEKSWNSFSKCFNSELFKFDNSAFMLSGDIFFILMN